MGVGYEKREKSRIARSGFTIIELLVVIAIIAILTVIAIVSYTGIQNKAASSELSSDLASVAKIVNIDQSTSGLPDSLASANSGAGITAPAGVTYQYKIYTNTIPQSFCVSATKNGLTYRVTGTSAPVQGSCTDYGLSSSKPGKTCRSLRLDGIDADGVFWIDPDQGGANTPFQVYCDMTYDGGGWTMLMKATRGTTFNYYASYWTTNNVLNDSDVSRNDADAKYRSFNEMGLTDIMARWPDAGDDRWLRKNTWSNVTALVGFNTFADWGSPFSQSYWDSVYFSTETGIYTHGTKLMDEPNTGAGARWGNIYNNETYYGSNDVNNGIGLTTGNYSAGDYVGCCQVNMGMNRSARVEVYGRNSNDTAD